MRGLLRWMRGQGRVGAHRKMADGLVPMWRRVPASATSTPPHGTLALKLPNKPLRPRVTHSLEDRVDAGITPGAWWGDPA